MAPTTDVPPSSLQTTREQEAYKEKSRKCQAWEKAYGNLRSQVSIACFLVLSNCLVMMACPPMGTPISLTANTESCG